jgi:hypothetical protein
MQFARIKKRLFFRYLNHGLGEKLFENVTFFISTTTEEPNNFDIEKLCFFYKP